MSFLPLVYAIVAGVGLATHRTLVFVRVYLAFMVLAGIAGTALSPFAAHRFFFWAFWSVDLIHNLLLCLVALEIISQLVPRRFILVWGTVFLALLVGAYVEGLPAANNNELLNLSISGMFVAGILLMSLVFFNVEWNREQTIATVGTAAIILGSALPAIRWIRGDVAALFVQLGPLAGLVFLATSRKRRQMGISVGVAG